MIYFDNSATTKPRESVVKYVLENAVKTYGNPSSLHSFGFEAEKKIEQTRAIISRKMNCDTKQIYFTSGGTMGNNICLMGAYLKKSKMGLNHLISTNVEHSSINSINRAIAKKNGEIDLIRCNINGENTLNYIIEKINDKTGCISIMHVNNEVGTIFDIEKIVKGIRNINSKIHIHVDGVQAFGKIDVDLKKLDVDSYTISGHKINAFKGIGAVYIKNINNITPILFGSNQENGVFPGTENVPGILSLGKAVEALCSDEIKHIEELKRYFIEKVKGNIDRIVINTPEKSAPHIVNISFIDTRAEVLLHYLEKDGIYVSTGAACSSKKKKHSRVLEAYGIDEKSLESAIRFSFGYENTLDEIDIVVESLKKSVNEIRMIMKR